MEDRNPPLTFGYSYYNVVVMGTTGIYDTHTALLYELAFTATRSVSGQCCEVKQRRARLVAGWVTQALEQGRLGSCAHAGYHQYYNKDVPSLAETLRRTG